MRPLSILTLLVLFTASTFAQVKSTLTVFSRDGEKFWVVKNGVKQNKDPQTSVTVDNITENSFKIKVLIDDEKLTSVDQSIYRIDVDNQVCNITTELKKKKKGGYTLSWPTMEPVGNGQTGTVVQESTVPAGNPTGNQNPGNQGQVNLPSMGFNMGVNPQDGTITTSTTITTTTTSGTAQLPVPPANPVTGTPPPHTGQAGYSKPQPCKFPMSPQDFAEAKTQVQKVSFSSDKQNIARQFTEANCLTVAQIKEVMGLFSFENDKLEYAKFAYPFTSEPNKYYLLNDALTYSSSRDELNQFVKSQK